MLQIEAPRDYSDDQRIAAEVADYAGEDASGVAGVDEVTNLIRPRVGGL